jgi:signal peptidase II
MHISKIQKIGILLGIVTLVLDQVSKTYVVNILSTNPDHIVNSLPFLNIILTWNNGITFGLFRQYSASHIIFSLLASLVTMILCNFLRKTDRIRESIALGMIIGGAIGNICDRIRFGAVIDFLDFHILHHHWYTFNIADAGICLGVALWITDNLYKDFKKK